MKKFLIAIILFSGVGLTLNAQRLLIEDATIALKNGNYDVAKEKIDLAFEDLSDKYIAKANYYRGWTYYSLAVDTNYTYLDKDAAYVSLQSYIMCLEAEKGERRKRWTADVLQTQQQGVPDIISGAIAVYSKALSYYDQKDYVNTVRYWDLLIKGYEADTVGNVKKVLKQSKNDIIQNCATVTLSDKKIDKAKGYLNRLINDPMYLSSTAYIQLSLLELENGDTTKALDIIAQGRKKIPDDKTLFNQELNLYTDLGRTDLMVKKLDEVIKNEPNNILYLFYRGNIVSSEAVKLSKAAAQYLDSSKEAKSGIKTTSDPAKKQRMRDNAAKFIALSDSGFAKSNRYFIKAEKDYKEALLIDPYYFDALFNTGVMHFNKTLELTTRYNLLDAFKPENKKIAEIMEKDIQDMYKTALEFLLKAEEVKPNDYGVLNALQMVYAQLNMADKSKEYKEKKDSINNK